MQHHGFRKPDSVYQFPALVSRVFILRFAEYVLSAKRQRSSEIYKRKNAMETEPSEQSDCELRAKHATIEAERVKFDEERDEKARDDAVTEPSCNFPVMTSLSSQQDGTYDIVDESSCVNLDVNDRGAAGRKPGANLSSMKTGTFARTCSSQQVRSAPQRAGADRTKVALDHSNAQHETQDVDPAGYGSVFEKAFFENCNSYDDIDEVDQPICAYKSMQDRRKEFRLDCAQRHGYDDVDEAVILPPNYDEVDDRVSIPPKGVVMFSNQDQQARKPAYCPATGVFPQQSPPHCQATTSYCPENSPFCPDSTTSVQKVPPMQMDPYESVSQSRQKMFECVRKVNDIMLEKKNELERQQMLLDEQRQLAARRQFSSSGMSGTLFYSNLSKLRFVVNIIGSLRSGVCFSKTQPRQGKLCKKNRWQKSKSGKIFRDFQTILIKKRSLQPSWCLISLLPSLWFGVVAVKQSSFEAMHH